MMKFWKEYTSHEKILVGKRKKTDNNIYAFDIETSSYFFLDGVQHAAIEYLNIDEERRPDCQFQSNMYIWMFSINETVYYGRTWQEFDEFLSMVDASVPEKKIMFIHNLAFEFQYLKKYFRFSSVTARKSHKVMIAVMEKYNFELRCSYLMTNCALKKLPEVYGLPVEKMVGDLDYDLIRHSDTPLTEKEMGYCEHDLLVIYYYILVELQTYKDVNSIPKTSTGHVRKELKDKVMLDFKYRRVVSKAINTNPHVYNLLQQAFMGGYTHANWIYVDEIIKDVDSWDFTSSYPFVMVTRKYPSTEFLKCHLKKAECMSDRFAYLLVVKFTNLKCKKYNNFISQSKCRDILNGKYDNGRVMEAEQLYMTLTDVDFKFILQVYDCEYEIIESYYSVYNYLPRQYIDFVLDKYVAKTQYKNVPGKELEYQLEKGKFNALYGMSVTNTIRDEVIYDNENDWYEIPLTNAEIEEKLLAQRKQPFLSFAYGVWVTAWARNNLLQNVAKLDENVIYCDTDSIKLTPGYDKSVIDDYNKSVEELIKKTSNLLNIDISRYAPLDFKGKPHMLGLFDDDGHYEEFITQGAKKYAVKQHSKIKITVAGVPKSGASALESLEEFRDDFVFDYDHTHKSLLKYCENQEKVELVDYLGNVREVSDISGCCILPTTYVLGKAYEFTELLTDNSSKRAVYKE